MTGYLELAARLERVTTPNIGLDIEIENACSPPTGEPKPYLARRYTSSLDAALALIPETWKLHFLQDTEYDNPTEKTWSAALRPRENNPVGNEEQSWCATPALALCAAALRARHAQEPSND